MLSIRWCTWILPQSQFDALLLISLLHHCQVRWTLFSLSVYFWIIFSILIDFNGFFSQINQYPTQGDSWQNDFVGMGTQRDSSGSARDSIGSTRDLFEAPYGRRSLDSSYGYHADVWSPSEKERIDANDQAGMRRRVASLHELDPPADSSRLHSRRNNTGPGPRHSQEKSRYIHG
jgi:hypothetical protein